MKTLLKIYISLCLILSPIFFINSANAATLGGWTIGDLIADGASSIVNGTKQVIIDGKDYIKKGTAKITPTASQVSKVLARGAAGYALSIAVEQLLGAVDWVLDPANNQITYKEKPSKTSNGQFLYACGVNAIFSSANAACSSRLADYSNQYVTATIDSCSFAGFSSNKPHGTCIMNRYDSRYESNQKITLVWNTELNPNATEEDTPQKSLPLPVVAQKVISNAEAEDANAKVATTAAAQDIINEAEQDETKARPIVQQLEASASTENADSAAQEAANEATGTSQPNTANPEATDIALEFPTFCGWAPVVCEAAQVAISFPTTAQTWVTDLLGVGQRIETEQKATTSEAAKTAQAAEAIKEDMANEEGLPQKDTTDIILPDLPITPQTVNVNWGNSCPPPTTATLSIFGQSTEITLIDYDAICEWAWVVEYSVIALASISSVFIVAGRKS
jgi:hypothetical protein